MNQHPGKYFKENYKDPQGLSTSMVAKRLGVSISTVSLFINGKQKHLSGKMVQRLATATETSIAFWLKMQMNWEIDQFKEIKVDTVPGALLPVSEPIAKDNQSTPLTKVDPRDTLRYRYVARDFMRQVMNLPSHFERVTYLTNYSVYRTWLPMVINHLTFIGQQQQAKQRIVGPFSTQKDLSLERYSFYIGTALLPHLPHPEIWRFIGKHPSLQSLGVYLSLLIYKDVDYYFIFNRIVQDMIERPQLIRPEMMNDCLNLEINPKANFERGIWAILRVAALSLLEIHLDDRQVEQRTRQAE